MPSPSSSQTSRTWRRCSCTSSQVWCMVSSGAPLSSNCPPGSSVIEHRASFVSAIVLPLSTTGFQPKRVIPCSSARDPVRPLIGHAAQIGAAENEFLVLGADPPSSGRLRPGFEIFDELPLVGDRLSGRARRGRHPRRNSSENSSESEPGPDMWRPAPIAGAFGCGANRRRSPEKPPAPRVRPSRRAAPGVQARPG